MDKVKLYAYVDETGLETSGRFFLVSVVLIEREHRDELEESLEEVEKKSKKNLGKWSKSSFKVREQFIRDVAKLQYLKRSVFYCRYSESKGYLYLIALSIAKAVEARGDDDCVLTVIIDALTDKDREKMRVYLKRLGVKYDIIRGLKDEQSVFLRLADSMAGFARDYIENQPYAQKLFALLEGKKIISEA
jgi:hypothetical protein